MSDRRALLVAVFILSVSLVFPRAAGAQAAAEDSTSAWRQTLDALTSRFRALPPDDEPGRVQLATELHDLDAQVSASLERRGLMVGQPAAEGTRLTDITAELSRVRALVEQASAGGSGAGVFYLGRQDVTVSAAPDVSGVTTVDAAQLRTLDAKTVTEGLAAAPGVTLYRTGPRNEGAVYIRGFDLRQVPVFIDGVPVYVPYDGYVDLDRFVTDDLSEIRVTKGMTSVLIGPNALGGAINLITKRPTQPLEGLFNATYASGTDRAFDANLGVMRPGWYAHGTASWLQADTFPLSGDFAPTSTQPAGDRENASRRDAKLSAKFALTPSGKGEYAVSYVLQRGQKDDPVYAGADALVKPRFWQWPDWDKDSVYFVSNTPLPGTQYLRGRAFYDRFYNVLNAFDDGAYATMKKPSSFTSIYDDYTDGASVEYGVQLPANQTLRLAGHLKEDIHREHNVGEPVRHFDNRTLSAGLEDTVAISQAVSLVVGVSADHQTTRRAENFTAGIVSSFPLGSTGGVNPQAALYVAVPREGRFRVAAYRKTRLPAIKDRYSYRMGQAIPNPDLAAEQATSAEIGYDTPLTRTTSIALTGFYTSVDNLVQPFYLEPNLFQLQNVGRVRNSGFEGEWTVRPISHVQGSLGYSYLHRENAAGTVVPLLNTPHNKLFGSIIYSGISRVRMIGSVNGESSRTSQDDAGTLIALPGFTTLMAKASYTIKAGLDAEIAMANAFDDNYELYAGYPEPGRTATVNLRYRLAR